MARSVSLESTVVAAADQVFCDLAGEAIILSLKSGTYYGLDAVGARIWQLLQTPRVVARIRDQVLEEFDVEPSRCEQELLALLEQLVRHSLVEVTSAAPA
jgi:hypothetical protein